MVFGTFAVPLLVPEVIVPISWSTAPAPPVNTADSDEVPPILTADGVAMKLVITGIAITVTVAFAVTVPFTVRV